MSEKKEESIADRKISRRSMLKWTAGLAVAGAVGIGVGYSASELLRPVPPTPEAVTETSYITVEKEQLFVNSGHSGPVSVAVRNGRIIRVDAFETPNWETIPTYKIEARGKTFKPTIQKSLMNSWHQAARRYVYSPERLLYPMKRVGYTPGGKGDISNRGKGEFVRISWDEALDTIASEMERLRTTYGLGAINIGTSAHYQTRGAFCDGIFDAVNRFLGLYAKKGPTPPDYPDAKNHLPHGGNWNHSWIGWACGPDNMVGYYWEKSQIWPPDDLLEDTLKNSNMVIYWSQDPTSTAQMYRGYEYEEYFRWIQAAGIKTVAITPNLNELAAFHCDKWIPVQPGYDIPLELAIAYVWFSEGTWDKAWVETHAVGMDKFQDYVMGKTDGVPKTPEWAAPKCGVKARDIRALAREWAKGPVFVQCNNGGANRGWNGDDWPRLIITLQTMQGNIGKPGGNLNGTPTEPALALRRPAVGRTGIGFILRADPWPIHFHPHYAVWADCIVNGNDKPTKWIGGTTGAVKYWKEFTMEHMYPYPGVSEVKMLGQQAPGMFNIEAGWFEDKARAWMTPKIECAWTATIHQNEPMARYSDIILPICTNFERVDITSIVNKWFVYMAKCVEPLGESISDMELFLRLAKRLGFGDTMYNGMSEEDMAKGLFQWSHGPKWITWEDFKKQGAVVVPFDPKIAGLDKYTPKPAMNWYYTKPKGDGLTTPTGMIEIYHQPFADAYGEDGPISAIPKWREPSSLNLKEGKDGPLATKYPLIAHIGHFKWRFHSEFGHVSWLRELYKIKGPDGYQYEPIWINPVDAQARGIKHGDVVKVSSNWGEMLCAAYLTERTMPGAPKITYGAWVDPVDPRNKSLDKGGNAESIMTSQIYKNHSMQICAEHVMVQIEKWGG